MANLTGFKSDNKGLFIQKDSQANVKYGMDFTDYLNTGDALSSAVVTIDTISGDSAPLALPTDAATDVAIVGKIVTVRLNGGTNGNIYNVRIKIVTSQGDSDARHFRVVVGDRQA